MRIAGLILAAGASRRFGAEDKLLAPFRGRPLAAHAARAMAEVPFDLRLAVVARDAVAELFGGFGVVRVAPGGAQSASLRAGLAEARRSGAERVLVTLADMPLVTPALIDAVRTGPVPGAATDGVRPMPPAILGPSGIDRALQATGDAGARAILAGLPEGSLIRVAAEMLVDMDRPGDIA